jgi:hypothetical protein
MGADKPIISITGKGYSTYLWVGNNADNNKGCFATVSGMKTLERFAFDLLKALGHKPNWILPEKQQKKKQTL